MVKQIHATVMYMIKLGFLECGKGNYVNVFLGGQEVQIAREVFAEKWGLVIRQMTRSPINHCTI